MTMPSTDPPRLVVIEPADQADVILYLSRAHMVIGHSDTADLVLNDRFVSRRHALVTVEQSGTVTITDLNSTSGTFVNDERLEGARILREGDSVRFADLIARFEPGVGPAPAPAPPGSQASVTQILPTSASTAGPVDPADPAGPDDYEPAVTYTVTGRVLSHALPGLVGLTVRLVDKNVGGDVVLATTKTDSRSGYAFAHPLGKDYLADHHKTAPDLQVKVMAGADGVLAASKIMYSAPATVSLDIVLPGGTAPIAGLPSEYETLTGNLAAAYTGSLGALRESPDQQDITYLANKTGWDARAVALTALAHQFSQITAPTPVKSHEPGQTAIWPPPVVSVRPEFYYALFRAGLPASADSLFRTSPATAQAVWENAIAGGLIPQDLAKEVPAAAASFRTICAAQSLDAAPLVGLSTLREMVAGTLAQTAQQDRFAELYVQHQHDGPGLWNAVEAEFGAEAAARLRLAGQLYYLTINNVPLVSALTGRPTDGKQRLTSAIDLVRQGLYEPAGWLPLIGESIPPQIPGASADERAANYSQLLAAQVRVAYPTAVVAEQVSRDALPVAGPPDISGSVAGFLADHQSEFVIGVEPVDAYVARTQTDLPDDVRAAVKRIQRAYQLTPDDGSMSVLLRHNLDSALAITRYDSAAFSRAFGAELGGTDKAAAIHARAGQVFASTLGVAVGYLGGRLAPALGGSSPVQQGLPPQAASTASPATAYPTLENLFGSLDYCGCAECGSILSPAAYLVDLLDYIGKPAAPGGASNPLDVLLARRPDLQYLPLTCANTNTALPYIDVVNELLEYVVANDCQIAGYQGHDTPDTITSAELVASPQYVNDDAYRVLQAAFFPPPLPFNRPLELLRLHLARLGISLPEAMTALRASDALTNQATPTSYGWNDILIERLTISRQEYRLFTDPTLGLSDLYGLPGPPAPSALTVLQKTSLQDFSRRLGISYADLVAIVSTKSINPNARLIERLERLNAPFATLKALHDTMNTPQSIAADFIQALPAGLDATEYGGASPTDYQAVVNWVVNPQNYTDIMSIIVITNPDGAAGDCSGSALQLRYSNPDNTANLLSATDFVKLIRFARLWGKLAPLLGEADAAVTIGWVDDIITALYPQADLPVDPSDSANDATNRPLLDAGFATLLPRTGFLFQVLRSLNQTAEAALGQLLACWAPIGTALYRRMFLTSALLAQDPGAQTATVAATVNAGDVLHTLINGVEEIPAYPVPAGRSAPAVAAAIAQAINTSAAPDPVDPVSGLQLSSRFLASTSPDNGVITIMAGFTLETAATGSESYTAAAGTPVSRSATVTGPVTPGDVLTTTINTIPISYQVSQADTTQTIAAGIAAAVNATTIADPYSGLPLNGLVVASVPSAASSEIDFTAVNAGAPFTLGCSLDPGNGGSYTAAPPVPPSATATITGTVTPGDVFVTTINSVPVSYTAGAADTAVATLASNIVASINAAVTVDPATLLPLGSEVKATSSGDVVTITATDPAMPLTLSCSAPPADGYVAAGPVAQTATATVSGTIPAGTTLTTTIDTLSFPYLTLAADTPASITAAIAGLINTTTLTDPVTGLPLTSVITASAAGGVLTLTGASTTTPFTLTVSMSASGYTAGQANPPFADNGYGDFLTDPSQTLFGHEPTLCAACNLTSAEFALITGALGFTPSTPLTLANVSAVFRYGWLAHALSLSVLEFGWLRQWTGLDPFQPLDPAAATPTEPPVVRFIRLIDLLQAASLTTSQALYLLWNQDITGKSSPPLTTITGLAAALATDFAAVDAQFTLQTDPDGRIAQNLMTLVYGATTSAFFFGLLNGTFTTSVSYSTPGGDSTLPQQVIDASGGRLSYDNLAKQLTFGGVLDQATLTAIDAAITAGAPDVAALTTAVAGLQAANREALGPFFSTYPELAPLYTAYVASVGTAQDKNNALLASFLPTLKRKRQQEQALAAVTAAAGIDPSFAIGLLTNPTIMHADADVTAPAVADLVAMENQGLSARFFLGNDLASPPDLTVDSVAALSYARTVALGGAATPGDVVVTTINGAAVPYTVANTDTTIPLLASSLVGAINGTQVTDPVSGLPLSQVVTAAVVAGGQAASTTVTIAGLDPSGAGGYFTLATSVTGAGTELYTNASQLPAGTGGGDIAATWSGYLTAPQDGFYDINVVADAGATITMEIGGAAVPMAQVSPAAPWSNLGPISLTAGALVPIAVTATSIKTTVRVSWLTQGTGWQPIGTQYLFPANLVSRLGNTYVRFLKASSLASALSLTAAEIAYLGAGSRYSVNTTDATVISRGSAVFTPASMTNIAIGSVLVVDRGTAQETVTVTAVTPTTFTAVAANAHDGTATPFAIVSQSFPDIGQGWLNFLIGAGWLTSVAARPGPDQATAQSLAGVLTSLCDFAVMKQAFSPADSRLLAVLQNPSATLPVSPAAAQPMGTTLPVSDSALLSLTGWNLASVNALLTQFFGSINPAPLRSVPNLRRVYDAYALVTACGLQVSVLISAITNAPTPTTVGALESALRAQYAASDWLTVVGPVNDKARISQRDALVAFIVQQLGDSYAASLVGAVTTADAGTGATQLALGVTSQVTQGMTVQGGAIAPGTTVASVANTATATTVTLSAPIIAALPAGSPVQFVPQDAAAIIDADSLYQWLLVDTQNEPAVLTSRILLALSTVQLFVERVVRNLEPAVSPADIDQSQWAWMKRYRVWQANREVFLWPENWLYPELRDDASPLFTQMTSGLLQGDITDDAAASAYLTYLTNLEEVAKLEPCGMYYVPGTVDTDETCYVVARTAGAHRKYYFRELTSGSWTPWKQVQIDCEDMPITPIVWNGRLFLFWLKATKQSQQDSATLSPGQTSQTVATMPASDLNDYQSAGASAATKQSVQATAVLYWTEFYNGVWQPPKTSDVNLPTSLGLPFDLTGPNSLESQRSQMTIVPARCTASDVFSGGVPFSLPPDSLMLAISVGGTYTGGFILHNTHSLPVRMDDIVLDLVLHLSFGTLTVPVPLVWILDQPSPSRSFAPAVTPPYSGGFGPGGFSVGYSGPSSTWPLSPGTLFQFSWIPRYVQPQPWLPDPWGAPFIYEDRRQLFYVETTEELVPFWFAETFGVTTVGSSLGQFDTVSPLTLRDEVAAQMPTDVQAATTGTADPATMRRFIAGQTGLAAALPGQLAVTYQGRPITPIGGLISVDRNINGQAAGEQAAGAQGE